MSNSSISVRVALGVYDCPFCANHTLSPSLFSTIMYCFTNTCQKGIAMEDYQFWTEGGEAHEYTIERQMELGRLRILDESGIGDDMWD